MGDKETLEAFLSRMWRHSEDNWVHIAIRFPQEIGGFKQFAYKWPSQRDHVISKLLVNSQLYDVWFSPSLWKSTESRTKENWLGSGQYWCDFDGDAPDETPKKVPEPSIKIQSSSMYHEHWYWLLDKLETDIEKFEGTNRGLAYTLNADIGCWDASRILRPPGTKNHKYASVLVS
ncbi:MAG TPA: hypothetical protein V6C65_14230 [Allocoleopsis sp.]